MPDNFFTAQLFENVEVRVSYVTVTDKCGENDYPITKFVFDRINTPEAILKTCGELEGYWSARNLDSRSLIEQKDNQTETIGSKNEITLRTQHSQRKTVDGVECNRFYFKMPINTGLAMTSRPLPKDVPLKFIFVRAAAEKSLLSIMAPENHNDLKVKSITLNNPQLVATMATSAYYDRKYAEHRIERQDFPYISPMIRTDILKEGQSTYKITVGSGSLPAAMVCLLMDPSALNGDYRESAMDFKQHHLEMIDLQVDSRSITNYPIRSDGGFGFSFYRKYLDECNFLGNALSAGGLDFENFQKNNFMICVENLKRKKLYTAGQLTMTLKFSKELDSKLCLVIVPVYQKKLNFDNHLNVTVSAMRVDEADEVDEQFESN